ncbi:MAG: delta-60 repeat domain-containing protein [Minisyncoccia bacterium]
MAQQPDGKLLVGGVFENYKDEPAAYLIRVGQ